MHTNRTAIGTLVGLAVGITCTLGIAAAAIPTDQPVTPETIQPLSADLSAPLPIPAPEVTQPLLTPEPTAQPVLPTNPPVGVGTAVVVCAPPTILAEDGSCVGEHFYDDAPIEEDDPRWDCRFDGNQRCGVVISGVSYVIQFIDGTPESVGYPTSY